MLNLQYISLLILFCIIVVLLLRISKLKKELSILKDDLLEVAFIKNAFHSLSLPVYYKDKNGKFLASNKTFDREFGNFKKDAIEKLSFVKSPSTCELTLTYDNAIEKVTSILSTSFLDEQNNILGSVSILINIDAQKAEKRQLIEQKNRLHLALENSQEGYFEWDIDKDKAIYSSLWKKIMGYNPEDDEPTNVSSWLNLVHSLDLAKTNEKIKEHLDARSDFLEIEHRVKIAQENFWVNVRAKAVFDSQNHPKKLVGTIRDITHIKQSEGAIIAEKNLFTSFMDDLPILTFIKNAQGKYLYINNAYQKFLGFRDWRGKTLEEIYPEKISSSIKNSDREAIYEGINSHEELIPDATGEIKRIKTFKFLIERQGEVLLCGSGTDVTSQRRLEEQNHLYFKVFDDAKDSILITDASKRVIAINKAFEKLTGFLSNELKGQSIEIRNSQKQPKEFYENIWQEVDKHGFWAGEMYSKNKNRTEELELVNIHTILDLKGNPRYYYMIIQSLQKKNLLEAQLELPKDSITDLPNKTAFSRLLEISIAKAQRNQEKFSIVYVNVDDFALLAKKNTQEEIAQILKEISKKLHFAIRQNDILAKLDSDEFAIILEDIKTSHDISVICERIMSEMTKPIRINKDYHSITLSIGASIYPEHSSEAKKLTDFAHGSMYKAKRAGKNCFIIYQS